MPSEERGGHPDPRVDVVGGEAVPQRRKGVRQQGAEPVVEVLAEILSSFVQRGDEVGVAMSPSVYGFAGDIGDLATVNWPGKCDAVRKLDMDLRGAEVVSIGANGEA